SGAYVFRNRDGFSFESPLFYGGGSSDVLLADMDADGYADLMQCSPGAFSESITVKLNLGDGTFGSPVSYTVAAGPADMHAVDVDEDGILDLAVSCEFDLRVTILIGVGDGTFVSPTFAGPTGERPRAIALGDLDGDNHLDIAVANTFDTSVSVMLGAGDGTFGPPTAPYVTGPSPEDIVIADFNEDGDNDVAVIESSTGLMRVLFGDGDGTFTGETTIVAGSVAEELAAVDFNEDGHMDLAGTTGAWDRVSVALGAGDGTFGAPILVGTARDPFTLAVTDFNQDGDLDMVTGNILGDDLTVVFGTGDGHFTPTIGTGFDPRGTAASDFDGDGRIDLAVTNQSSDSVSVFLNQGDRSFRLDATHATGEQPTQVIAADVTGDLVTDLVVGSFDFFAPGAYVLAGNGDGTFAAPVTQEDVHDEVRWMDLADFDGNGSLDLVITRDGNPGLLWYPNNGGGGFSSGTVLSTDIFLQGVVAVDVAGSALPDIVVGRDSFPGQILVYVNNGAGFDPPIATVMNGSGLDGIELADLDDDGVLDLVASTDSFGEVRVMMGLGGGSYAQEVDYDTGSNALDVALGDVDDDGVLDIVAACAVTQFDTSNVSVLIGLGDGTFAPEQSVRMGSKTSNVTVADFDGDGVDDVAASVTDSNHVAMLYSNEGPWTPLTKGLAGTNGIPRQLGTGTLESFAPYEFTLRDARESSFVLYFVGVAQLNVPFKGGTMVPDPLLPALLFETDPAGTLALSGAWPPGASGGTIVLQFWVIDPAGPLNYAASNALSASIP
ncbi:MAG: FG-GAP repeat domain-containing protein, partial [Planctomycetota bacterium]